MAEFGAAAIVLSHCRGRAVGAATSESCRCSNGERSDSLNLWGGPFRPGNIAHGGFTKQSTVVHSGTGAYQANLGSIAEWRLEFFQTFSSGLSGNASYRQDRDLTQYQTLEGYVRNDTGNPLTFSLELKDYRDSESTWLCAATRFRPAALDEDRSAA